MCVCKCTVLKGVSKCVSAPPPQSCAQHALAMRIVGNKAGVQESSSHSRCTVKRGGSGVASCSAESPGQPRPGAMRTLSLADGRWKEGSTEEREPCAWGGVQACGSGVTSCSAESPGQPRPSALRTLSLADGCWKEGSTEEREPCARGGVQACVQRRQITTDHGSPLQLAEYEIE
jgi:hypothetical protein